MKKKVLSWGTLMCDIIAPEMDKIAEPGVIEYLTKGIEMHLGGHCIDLIIDLAKIGVDPNEIAVVSTIGTDIIGDFLLREISPYGFKSFIERVEGGTGKTMILGLKDRDRLCHLDPGACQRMSLSHLENAILEAQPEFFSFRPGYTNLDLEIAPLLKRLRNSVLKNTFLLLDLCAPYKKGWDYYLDLLPYVDAVHGNSKEIARAAGEPTLEKAADKMLSMGVGAVLLTKEKEGAEILTPKYIVSQPSFDIKFVEPSGCGDAFCAGGFYAMMKSGKKIAAMNPDEMAEVLLWAQALGASAATQVGCVEGITADGVCNLVKYQGERLLKSTSTLSRTVRR
jgi:sugar/nucleoside kinase (ribokinase family)